MEPFKGQAVRWEMNPFHLPEMIRLSSLSLSETIRNRFEQLLLCLFVPFLIKVALIVEYCFRTGLLRQMRAAITSGPD